MKIWLLGAGPMAVDYFRVLTALGVHTTVIGRGKASAESFTATTGVPAITEALESILTTDLPDAAIVSVSIENLSSVATRLLQGGVRNLLVEKPAALDEASLRQLRRLADEKRARVFVAYNRRCYAAALHAKRIIGEDGGLLSCNFEFTEWAHVIEPQSYASSVKARWFLANSTHVADLVFHLGGAPAQLDCHVSGSLPWHPAGSMFAGSGVSERGVLYSYQANWSAPGRWGLEALTSRHRLIFRPMESLQVMRKGSVAVEPVAIDDALDKAFKPGLHEQVRRFLEENGEGLCSLQEHVRHWPWYCRMAGYDDAAAS